jgi:glycerate-2-kinase
MLNSAHLPTSKLSQDALAIWRAGVDAVRADRVIKHHLFASRYTLATDEHEWELDPRGRLIIVGAGKAAFMMTKGFLRVAEGFDARIQRLGWVNVPEGTAIESLDHRITISEARPAGVNEPTLKVLQGTQRILDVVNSATSLYPTYLETPSKPSLRDRLSPISSQTSQRSKRFLLSSIRGVS